MPDLQGLLERMQAIQGEIHSLGAEARVEIGAEGAHYIEVSRQMVDSAINNLRAALKAVAPPTVEAPPPEAPAPEPPAAEPQTASASASQTMATSTARGEGEDDDASEQ